MAIKKQIDKKNFSKTDVLQLAPKKYKNTEKKGDTNLGFKKLVRERHRI
jgi:hypothetical protein